MRTFTAKHLLPLACAFLVHITAAGQNPVSYLNDTGSPAYATTVPVENGYINLSNGNLHLEFPLASPPQRGTLQLLEKLTYDSRFWAFSPYYPFYQWLPNNVYGSIGLSGWRFVSGQPAGGLSGDSLLSSTSIPCYVYGGTLVGEHDTNQSSLTYFDESQTPHQTTATVTVDENSVTPSEEWLCGEPYSTTTYTPGTTSDGSGYTVGVDGSGYPYVLDSGGNEVSPTIMDRYGNYLSIAATSGGYDTSDATGRVPVIVTHYSSTITYYDVLAPNGPISNNGTRVRYIVTTSPLSVTTSFGNPYISEYTGTLNPVTSIQLPDGSSYTFSYDSFGELSSVTLPTGGTVSYSYANFTDSMNTPNRWLTSRRVGTDPAESFNQSVITSCSGGSTGCQEAVAHYKPNGDETVYTQTLNNGAWTTGIAVYSGSAQLAQMTSSNLYTNTCAYPCSSPNYISSSLTTTELFPSGTGSAQYSQIQKTFDAWSSKPLTVKEWDLASSASTTTPPGGTPTRETDYTYTGLYSWTIPKDLQSVKVLDSTGNQASLTTYGYTTSATSAGSITQHGSALISPQYLHTVTQWSNTALPSPVTTYSMDDTGQVLSVQDPDGHSPTTIAYQCANSLPLQVANSLGQQTAYGYDCSSGAITSVRDPNDLANSRAGTTYSYESGAGRVQAISYPDGGSTTYSYPNAVEIDTTVAASPDPSISSASILDSYGRAYQTVQNGITRETTYDINGRVNCVTNPHASSPSSTDGTTCITSYDGFDRPLIQQQADGSTRQWTYSQNTVLVTDEVGHQTMRTSDALGHLKTVAELLSGTWLATNYTYDGLGNLTKINQLGNGSTDSPRVRTFTYDSLSRLLCASNPENSSAPCPTSATSSYTAGTVGYGYDANGNRTSMTDARGITVSSTYDALNRPLTVTATGINNQYIYDSLSGFPNNNSIGRVVLATNNVTADEIFSYDPMGRVNWQVNYTPSSPNNWSIVETANYDLAGNMTDFTYPDGRHIHQSFDASGRLTGVNYADWGGTPVNYPYVSSLTYSPLGGMSALTLGNGVTSNISYNNRSQPCEIQAGYPATPGSSTTATAYDKQYYFASTGGSICGTTSTNNGNIWRIVDALSPTAKTQQFGFDSLNRLTSATRADNGFTYNYNIDSFGNMEQQNNLIYNPVISFPGTSNQIQVGGIYNYSYDAAGNLLDTGSSSGGHHYTYDSLGQQTQVDYGSTASYTYDGMGGRVRKDTSTGWTEYVRFGGQVMAEKSSSGSWSDYIYANGQKIAKADTGEGMLQVTGTAGGGGYWQWYDTNMLHGYVIQSGDHLVWRQYGSSSAQGGMLVQSISGGNSAWLLYDSNGRFSNQSTVTGQWEQRNVDISPGAGQSISLLAVGLDTGTTGTATLSFADIAIIHADGSVSTVFNGQALGLSAWPGNNSMSSPTGTFTVGQPAGSSTPLAAHYYLADHLDTTRVEFASGGWPVWGQDYAPYGQEITPAATSNNYKFASYERDPETGNDYAQARYYSSSIAGRFMSPDPYSGSMDTTNPQSFNRYTYALNNPVEFSDPTGLEWQANSNGCWDWGYSEGDFGAGVIANVYCSGVGFYPGYGGGGGGGGEIGSSGGGGGGTPGNPPPPSSRSGYESLFCLGDALKKNGLFLALDTLGLIPEAEGFTKVYENMVGYQIARKAGNALGYRGIVATQQGAKAVTQGKGAIAMLAGALGLQDRSTKGIISTGATIVGLVGGPLGTVAAIVSIGKDLSDIDEDQSSCVASGKYD